MFSVASVSSSDPDPREALLALIMNSWPLVLHHFTLWLILQPVYFKFNMYRTSIQITGTVDLLARGASYYNG